MDQQLQGEEPRIYLSYSLLLYSKIRTKKKVNSWRKSAPAPRAPRLAPLHPSLLHHVERATPAGPGGLQKPPPRNNGLPPHPHQARPHYLPHPKAPPPPRVKTSEARRPRSDRQLSARAGGGGGRRSRRDDGGRDGLLRGSPLQRAPPRLAPPLLLALAVLLPLPLRQRRRLAGVRIPEGGRDQEALRHRCVPRILENGGRLALASFSLALDFPLVWFWILVSVFFPSRCWCCFEGVCGGTASGKTTVCDMIIQQLHDHRVVLVNQVWIFSRSSVLALFLWFFVFYRACCTFGPVPQLCYRCICVANSSGLFVLWMLCESNGFSCSSDGYYYFCLFVCVFWACSALVLYLRAAAALSMRLCGELLNAIPNTCSVVAFGSWFILSMLQISSSM